MKLFRKIVSLPFFLIGSLTISYIAISIPLISSFSGFIFMILFYGTVALLFSGGAMLIWNMKKWKTFTRNILVLSGIVSLLVSMFAPIINDLVFNKYGANPELESFKSLGTNSLIGSIILFLLAGVMTYFLKRDLIKPETAL